MENKIIRHKISNFITHTGAKYELPEITYQIIGKELHTAPIVLINHALTGNSDVASEKAGWWKTIIGKGKLIDTEKYTIIAFNIPGNGYDGNLINNYKDYNTCDIAKLFIKTLKEIEINELFVVIGGSLGGGIGWEMAVLEPNFIKYLIPVACDWKSTDWIIGHNYIQEKMLTNSAFPLQDARMMAMLFYRTPASFTHKFERSRTKDNKMFNVESWLQHHGDKLQSRFDISSYKLMNHLLTTIDIARNGKTFEEVMSPVKTEIIQVGIDSDLFFVREENIKTKEKLDKLNIKNSLFEIKSLHGHDGFLIEFEQLTQFLLPVFQ